MPNQRRTKSKVESKTIDFKEVPIDYTIPADIKLLFADGLIVQHGENEFILSFFQTLRPIILTEDDRKGVEKVESRCVARIVVTPQQMAKNVEALKENFEKWLAKMQIFAEGDSDVQK